jgi:hypothetical protein
MAFKLFGEGFFTDVLVRAFLLVMPAPIVHILLFLDVACDRSSTMPAFKVFIVYLSNKSWEV